VSNGTLIMLFVTKKSQYLLIFRIITRVIQKSENIMIQNVANKKCPDCDSELNVPCDIEKGEILSCPGCGLELEVKKTNDGGGCVVLQELTIEGEDWGE
jgi:uncharacterized paraquat-inducible protein A